MLFCACQVSELLFVQRKRIKFLHVFILRFIYSHQQKQKFYFAFSQFQWHTITGNWLKLQDTNLLESGLRQKKLTLGRTYAKTCSAASAFRHYKGNLLCSTLWSGTTRDFWLPRNEVVGYFVPDRLASSDLGSH